MTDFIRRSPEAERILSGREPSTTFYLPPPRSARRSSYTPPPRTAAGSPTTFYLPAPRRALSRRSPIEEAVRPQVPEISVPDRTPGEVFNDTMASFGIGATGAGTAMTDVFGANSAPSRKLRDWRTDLEAGFSPGKKAELAKQAQESAALGEDAPFSDRAWLKARQLARNPVATVAEGAGAIVPLVGAGVVAAPLEIPASAMAIGTAVWAGVGAVKGQISDTVKGASDEELQSDPEYADMRRKGVPEEVAKERLAERLQSYAANPGKIAVGGVIGGLAGRFGADEALVGLLGAGGKNAIRAVLEKEALNASLGGVTKGLLKEASTEGLQEGAEQYLGNTGAGSGGARIDPMAGVAESIVAASAMAALPGAGSTFLSGAHAKRSLAELNAGEALDQANQARAPKLPQALIEIENQGLADRATVADISNRLATIGAGETPHSVLVSEYGLSPARAEAFLGLAQQIPGFGERPAAGAVHGLPAAATDPEAGGRFDEAIRREEEAASVRRVLEHDERAGQADYERLFDEIEGRRPTVIDRLLQQGLPSQRQAADVAAAEAAQAEAEARQRVETDTAKASERFANRLQEQPAPETPPQLEDKPPAPKPLILPEAPKPAAVVLEKRISQDPRFPELRERYLAAVRGGESGMKALVDGGIRPAQAAKVEAAIADDLAPDGSDDAAQPRQRILEAMSGTGPATNVGEQRSKVERDLQRSEKALEAAKSVLKYAQKQRSGVGNAQASVRAAEAKVQEVKARQAAIGNFEAIDANDLDWAEQVVRAQKAEGATRERPGDDVMRVFRATANTEARNEAGIEGAGKRLVAGGTRRTVEEGQNAVAEALGLPEARSYAEARENDAIVEDAIQRARTGAQRVLTPSAIEEGVAGIDYRGQAAGIGLDIDKFVRLHERAKAGNLTPEQMAQYTDMVEQAKGMDLGRGPGESYTYRDHEMAKLSPREALLQVLRAKNPQGTEDFGPDYISDSTKAILVSWDRALKAGARVVQAGARVVRGLQILHHEGMWILRSGSALARINPGGSIDLLAPETAKFDSGKVVGGLLKMMRDGLLPNAHINAMSASSLNLIAGRLQKLGVTWDTIADESVSMQNVLDILRGGTSDESPAVSEAGSEPDLGSDRAGERDQGREGGGRGDDGRPSPDNRDGGGAEAQQPAASEDSGGDSGVSRRAGEAGAERPAPDSSGAPQGVNGRENSGEGERRPSSVGETDGAEGTIEKDQGRRSRVASSALSGGEPGIESKAGGEAGAVASVEKPETEESFLKSQQAPKDFGKPARKQFNVDKSGQGVLPGDVAFAASNVETKVTPDKTRAQEAREAAENEAAANADASKQRTLETIHKDARAEDSRSFEISDLKRRLKLFLGRLRGAKGASSGPRAGATMAAFDSVEGILKDLRSLGAIDDEVKAAVVASGAYTHPEEFWSPPSPVDVAAKEAEVPKSDAQKEAGTYKKGHTSISGMPISIENEVGSWRHGYDLERVKKILEVLDRASEGSAQAKLQANTVRRALKAFSEGDARVGYRELETAGNLLLRQHPAIAEAIDDVLEKGWRTEMRSHYGYFKGTVGKDKDHIDVFIKPGTPQDYAGPVFVVNQYEGGNLDEHKVMLGFPDAKAARTGYLENYSPGWKGLKSMATFPTVDEFKGWLKDGDHKKDAPVGGTLDKKPGGSTIALEGANEAQPPQRRGPAGRNEAAPALEAVPDSGAVRPLDERGSKGRSEDGEGRDAVRSPRGAGDVGERSARPDERAGVQPPERRREAADRRSSEPALNPPSDFSIPPDADLGAGGAKAKFRGNLDAIRLLKKLREEGRRATAEEQATLVKYVGWGGLKQAFNANDASWSNEYAELKAALSPEEYAAARASVLNAHYTSRPIIQGIWSALQRLGFQKGRVLEPSAGVGHFLGLAPAGSTFTAVELDRTTGDILQHLYQKQNTLPGQGFQEVNILPESFDAAIGNPPFGNEPLSDRTNSDLPKGLSIHNFFFAKSVDALRPGGVLGMVVSNSFLDAQTPIAREWIAKRTKLLGAIRLPNNAFAKNAGTEVTTDIVFLQKLPKGETSSMDWTKVGKLSDIPVASYDWTGTEGAAGIPLNSYFVKHPEMMLGNMKLEGKMYRKGTPALIARPGQDIQQALATAIERLPKDVFVSAGPRVETLTDVDGLVPEGLKVGSVFVTPEGAIGTRLPDVEGQKRFSTEAPKSGTQLERVKGLIGVRDALRALMRGEMADASAEEISAARKRLNSTYDGFVKKYGFINSQVNRSAFRDDVDLPLLESLEPGYDPGLSDLVAKKLKENPRKPSAKKADIFSKRVLFPFAPTQRAETPKDALLASLNERGGVDMDFMSKILGKSPDEIMGALQGVIFRNPDGGGFVHADEYLGGPVKAKLAAAQTAVEQGRPEFQENVDALEKVIPPDIDAVDISVRVGSPWVPGTDVADFVTSLVGGTTRAKFIPAVAKWIVETSGADPVANGQKWGTPRMAATDILRAIMANQAVVVRDNLGTSREPKWVVNEPETQAAQAKADEIFQQFKDWIWADQARRERLSRFYNDTFNTEAEKKYDGSHLTLPGTSPLISLRPHQKSAIWRALQDRTILLDHVVGAGKTFAAVATVMEARRLGIARKPMIVVPNHLVRQWRDDFYKLYPNANILATTEKDFDKTNRQRLFSKITTGDWDAVIVAKDSLKKIGMPAETMAKVLGEQIGDITEAIEAQKKAAGADRNLTREMERIRAGLQEKLNSAQARTGKKDQVVTFDELGVDGMVVDEAHDFKNLFFVTSMRTAGLGNPKGSGRAFDLFVKMRYLTQKFGGKALRAFATGTPVSNSLVEMYTMQRFMNYDALRDRGIHQLDAWAGAFGNIANVYEVDASGTGYRMRSRFAQFVNMPELMGLYRSFADVITTRDLEGQAKAQGDVWPVPAVAGGKPRLVVAERSPQQAAYFGQKDENGQWNKGSILWRIDNLRNVKDPREDNMLKITNDARKAGLDYRLTQPGAPDFAGSKINLAADEIVRIHKDWKDDKGTQLVFLDLSTPKSAKGKASAKAKALEAQADLDEAPEQSEEEAIAKGEEESISMDDLLADSSDFSVYDDLRSKLVAKGIPQKEIAFIHDYDTADKKRKLYTAVNRGDIRVLLGSTGKMGAGMNVQERLVALHHLDAPWRPSDLEQREGRIVRQGNSLYKRDPKGFAVELLRYATKQTYDTRMWQLIEHKANGVEQLRRGDPSMRVVEDVGGEAANAGEMKAAASGNPLIEKEIRLRGDLKRLEALEQAFKRNKFQIDRDIASAQVGAVRSRERAAEIRKGFKDLTPAEPFQLKAGKKVFTEKSNAVEPILSAVKSAVGRGREGGDPVEYRGLVFRFAQFGDALDLRVEHDDLGDTRIASWTKGEQVSPGGVLQRVDNWIKGLPDLADRTEAEAAAAVKAEASLKEEAKKTFKQADDLVSARKAHAAVVAELKAMEKPTTPPPAAPKPEGEEESKFAVRRAGASRGAGIVDLGSVQREFRGARVDEVGPGHFEIRDGLRTIQVRVDEKGLAGTVDPAAFRAAYGRPFDPEQDALMGAWTQVPRGGVMWLARAADEGILRHERFHYEKGKAPGTESFPAKIARAFGFGAKMALSEAERAALYRRFEGQARQDHERRNPGAWADMAQSQREKVVEEYEADAYAQWRPEAKADSLFSKILRFARQAWRAFRPSWESAFERVSSGNTVELAQEGDRAAGARYAARARADTATPEPVVADSPIRPLKAGEGRVVPIRPMDVDKTTERVLAASGGVGTPEGKPLSELAPPEFHRNMRRVLQVLPEEDAKKLARLYDAFDEENERARRVISWETADKQALKLMQIHTRDQFMKMAQSGVVLNEPGLRAATRFLYEDFAESERTKNAWLSAKERGLGKDSKEYSEFVAASLKVAGSMLALRGEQAEAARAFNARKDLKAARTPSERLVGALFKRMGNLSESQVAEVMRISETEPEKLGDFVRDMQKPGFWDYVNEYRKSAMLFSPRTYGVNFFGNALKQAVSLAEIPVAAAVDKARGVSDAERTVFAGELGASLAALSDYGPKALKDFAGKTLDALRGVETFDPEENRPIEHQLGVIPGPAGKLVRTTFRMLNAADSFFKDIAGRQSIYREAYKRARKAGLSGRNATERADLLVRIYDATGGADRQVAGMKERAIEAAQYETFTKAANWENSGAFGLMANLVGQLEKKAGIVGLFVPFKGTPANIAYQGFERSPFGFLAAKNRWSELDGLRKELEANPNDAGLRAAIEKKAEEAANQTARALIGTALFSVAIAAAFAGNLTGAGPADPDKRKVWQKAGHLSTAVRVGESDWYAYDRLEPMAASVALAANVPQILQEKGLQRQTAAFMNALQDAWVSKTYLQGVEQLADVLSDPYRYGQRWLRDLEGSFVPSGVAQLAEGLDPVVRDNTRGGLDPLKARLPGLSEDLEPSITGTGEPATRTKRVRSPLDLFGFIRTGSAEGDELAKEFLDADYEPTPHRKTMAIGVGPKGAKKRYDVALTPEELELFRRADAKVTTRLRTLVQSPAWKDLDPYVKKVQFQRIYDRASTAVRALILPRVARRLRSQLAEERANGE